MCANLRNWGDTESIVSGSLRVMVDVTGGFETSKLLLSLNEVQFVLLHHTVALSSSLHSRRTSSRSYRTPRSRTTARSTSRR